MRKAYDYPLIVIGAGAGGLVVAIGAAKAGKKVLLVDRGNWGGDCTNFGCIPSKTLIASAHAAYTARNAAHWGLDIPVDHIQASGVLKRVRQTVRHFVDHESPSALKDLNVDSLEGTVSFVDKHTLQILPKNGNERFVSGREIVIATGSSPAPAPIEGIDKVPYHTNESIFSLERIPKRLCVIGGGTIGAELAQAFGRLGSEVTVIEFLDHLLGHEDSQARKVIEQRFEAEGITLHLNCAVESVEKIPEGITVRVKRKEDDSAFELFTDELLVATGRRPNIDDLNLEAAGIDHNRDGIKVDGYGRTSAKNVWAVGDCTGGAMFTHVAEAEARAILSSLLLPGPFRSKLPRDQAIPRVTFTDPEVAAIGLSEQEAIELYGKSRLAIYYRPMPEVDRAVTEGQVEGFVKIITFKWSSKIIGATIVCPRAGEMLTEISAMMHCGQPLRKLAGLIHPYPTYSQGIRKAADGWLTETILPILRKFFGR